jgi:hypothetical protein
MKKWIVPLLLASAASVANASSVTTQVLDVRMNASTVTAGSARVSVLTSGSNSCSTGGWYAFEYPDSGSGAAIGKVWAASVLSALASGRQVAIYGTGTCDQFGIEILSFIDAL